MQDRECKKRKLSHSLDREKEGNLIPNGHDSHVPPPANALEPGPTPTRPAQLDSAASSGRGARIGSSHTRKTGAELINRQPFSPGALGKSSIMTLQIDELLTQIKPNHGKQISRLKDVLHRVKEIAERLPEVPSVSAAEAEMSLKRDFGVTIPFPQPRPTEATRYQFEYRRPANVNVVGSLPLMLSTQEDNLVEMAVTMPESILQEKDYLNYRVFQKRAYYLARLAGGIKEAAPDEFKLSFEYQDDVQLLPVLIVSPTDKSPTGFAQSKCRIRIFVAQNASAFPIEKTLPTKNCVRSAAPDSDSIKTATPFYNTCVRWVASTASFHSLLHQATLNCDAFKDVSILGRTWLRQRGFHSSISSGGFGWVEWSLVCALLMQGGGPKGGAALSSRYNSLQLFKAVLQFLAGKDLTEGMILNSPYFANPSKDLPLFYDGRTGVNILFKMKPWSYRLLRHEAGQTLQAINARSQENFDPTFIIRTADSIFRFDEIYNVDATTFSPRSSISDASLQRSIERIYELLIQGMGDRVELIHIKAPGAKPWSISDHAPVKCDQDVKIDIGLLLRPENTSRLVDHGPSAEDSKASMEFREFWGDKAELRRFKDGSISESLIWSEDSPVTQQIIEHVLYHHLKLPPRSVAALQRRFGSLLGVPGATIGPNDTFRLLSDTYQSMTSQLYQLEGLPLSIRSIHPADSQLRSTSLRCPLIAFPLSPANVLIQFEGSARWPDSLPAIQHTKIAFLVKLAEVLSASHPEVETRVGLENTSTAHSGHLNTSFLDIIYPAPARGIGRISFRLRIQHDREQTLLERALKIKELHGSTRDLFATTLAAYKRDFVASVRHTTAFRNLCTRHPALSPTTRLLKKWASSHLLSTHLPDELLELVTAKVFVHPSPWTTPATAQTGFLRALRLLSRWDWTAEPLIVDLSGNADMTAKELAAIATRFQAWRTIDPGLNNVIMFAASNIDNTGVAWTQGARPSRVVAARLTALAQASIELVKSRGLALDDADWASMFKSPLTDFDFLIHLKPSVVPGGAGKGKGDKEKYKNLAVQDELDLNSIGFDPIGLFLQDLEEALGPHVLFFHDADGGDVIAGLWNPRSLGQHPWRVRRGYSTAPVNPGEAQDDERKAVVMNQSAILAEIAMLGEGLIEKVDLVKKVLKQG